MPVATVSTDTERFDLKTAPPDGYVDLRPLPYGMKLERRSKATKMMMRMPTQNKGNKQPTEANYELETMDQLTAAYDFAYCIVDHNLTDANDVKLDFANPMTLKALNPKIGSEIEALINSLNEDEDEESLEDFLARSTSSSESVTDTSVTAGGGDKPTPLAEEAQN